MVPRQSWTKFCAEKFHWKCLVISCYNCMVKCAYKEGIDFTQALFCGRRSGYKWHEIMCSSNQHMAWGRFAVHVQLVSCVHGLLHYHAAMKLDFSKVALLSERTQYTYGYIVKGEKTKYAKLQIPTVYIWRLHLLYHIVKWCCTIFHLEVVPPKPTRGHWGGQHK